MKIYLDDERPTPEGWVRCYWPEEVIELLENNEVEMISLDHDLGDDEHGTGNDVILWIEQKVIEESYVPPLILLHTANTSARHKMMLGLQSIFRIRNS